MNNQPPPVIVQPTPNNQPPPVVEQPNLHTKYLLRQAEIKYEIALLLSSIPWLLFGWLIFIPLFTIPLLLLILPFEIIAYFLRKSGRALVEYAGVDFKQWHKPIGFRDGIVLLLVMAVVFWGAWQVGGQFWHYLLKFAYANN